MIMENKTDDMWDYLLNEKDEPFEGDTGVCKQCGCTVPRDYLEGTDTCYMCKPITKEDWDYLKR